jgi:hypothetical protein
LKIFENGFVSWCKYSRHSVFTQKWSDTTLNKPDEASLNHGWNRRNDFSGNDKKVAGFWAVETSRDSASYGIGSAIA